jgi:hypothetical protein
MDVLNGIGKIIAFAGVLLLVLGGLLVLASKLPGMGDGMGWIGKLPGDIFIKRDSFTFYFPLATSILLSVIVSLLLYFFSLFRR